MDGKGFGLWNYAYLNLNFTLRHLVGWETLKLIQPLELCVQPGNIFTFLGKSLCGTHEELCISMIVSSLRSTQQTAQLSGYIQV